MQSVDICGLNGALIPKAGTEIQNSRLAIDPAGLRGRECGMLLRPAPTYNVNRCLVIGANKEAKLMRLVQPRIPPLPPEEWSGEIRELLSGLERDGRVFNIFATLARHPALLRRWLVFGNHVLAKSTLPPRERELAILRMGWLCRAEYEWGHHVAMGKAAGVTAEEISRVGRGADAAGWSPFEAALLKAVDELHADSFIGEATWQALAQRYNEQQLLDLIFTAGQYKLVCMALNSVGVQLEEGYEKLPAEA